MIAPPLRHRSRLATKARWGIAPDRGTAAVEFVIVAPLLALLLLLVAGLGRIAAAHGRVEGAARDAARAASLQRLPSEADTAGHVAARGSLARQDVSCATLSVTIDAEDDRPGGQVTATVRCTVRLAGLGFAGFRGSYTATATAVAPIEMWRGETLGLSDAGSLPRVEKLPLTSTIASSQVRLAVR